MAHDVIIERFMAWPYDVALSWMADRWHSVVAGGPMCIGVGVHSPAVVTLGRNAPLQQIVDAAELARKEIEVVHVDRGGGATLHAPGQLVLYPIVNLRLLRLAVPAFTELLLQAVVDLLREHDVESELLRGVPGVYVEGRKIASVGFRWRRGVVTHGLSLNICNDLDLYAHIDACGETDREATSLAQERSNLKSASDDHHETPGEDVAKRDLGSIADRLVTHFVDRAVLRSGVMELTAGAENQRGTQSAMTGRVRLDRGQTD